MSENNDQMKARRVQLLEDRGETSRFTHAEINEQGKFIISTCDIGKTPEEVFGDSDYEFWVTVLAEHKDMLLLALIEKLYAGRFSAVDEFRDFLESKGIPHKFENWA